MVWVSTLHTKNLKVKSSDHFISSHSCNSWENNLCKVRSQDPLVNELFHAAWIAELSYDDNNSGNHPWTTSARETEVDVITSKQVTWPPTHVSKSYWTHCCSYQLSVKIFDNCCCWHLQPGAGDSFTFSDHSETCATLNIILISQEKLCWQ